MKLLGFQQSAVDRVRAYLVKVVEMTARLSAVGPTGDFDVPFMAWSALGAASIRPYSAIRDVTNRSIPCVSVVIPTGGGKTVTAIASAIEAIKCGVCQHKFIVWVVPSEAIYEQTLRYLDGGYLSEYASGAGFSNLRLKTIGETWTDLDIDPDTLTVLLVTQQSIFGTRADLHFVRPSDALRNLGLWTGISQEPSLANLLDLLKPIFIIDEAHRVYTDSGRAFFRSRAPASCILEFSATPRDYSPTEYPNVIESVPASELIDEQLIKNPLVCVLEPGMGVSELLTRVVHERSQAALALSNARYQVAPKVLISCRRTAADQADDPLSAHAIRDELIDLGVKPLAIAIKSAELDQLKGQDIDSPNCGIEFILTQKALVEGWDAKSVFFVVLLNDIGAPLTNFQIVGRGMRQPRRQYFQQQDLNRLVVYANGLRQESALSQLRDFLSGEGLASGLAVRIECAGSAATKFHYVECCVRLPICMLSDQPDGIEAETCCMMSSEPPEFISHEQVIANAGIGGTTVIEFDLREQSISPYISGAVQGAVSGDVLWRRRFELSLLKQIGHEFRESADACAWIQQQADRLLSGLSPQLSSVGAVRGAQIVADHVRQHAALLRYSLVLRLLESSKVDSMELNSSKLAAALAPPDPPGTLPFAHNLFGDVPKSLFNKSELHFAYEIERLGLPWIRNQVGSGWYSLPGGSTGRFFPDFIVPLEPVSPDGFRRVALFETKGEHILGNFDSERKQRACQVISRRSGGRIEAHFGTFTDLVVALQRTARVASRH
jgi:hypothetical protein